MFGPFGTSINFKPLPYIVLCPMMFRTRPSCALTKLLLGELFGMFQIEVMMGKEIVILHRRRCGNLCSFGVVPVGRFFLSKASNEEYEEWSLEWGVDIPT